ncbi:hypothetical protein BDZ94DRAFT_1156163 [Collybia nuda]|uniref:Uncharacterized protein n=1 Tax=Collybia nuda TaxID=64659 RepID=A0A9P6CIF2_9AGAR|nr:hypothetical protein BDZ94DRAFT_1156163 [Collybia nuda]
MDNPSPAVLPIPRLRLSRNAHLYETSGAGPSRSRFQDHLLSTPVDFNHNSEDNSDDDQLPTPRITSTIMLGSAETPAERLRAVLARVPTSAKSTHMPHSPVRTPSILDSDFEPPDGYPATPTIARESLKAIFSRAVRDPGDTPQKERDKLKRRNSIDASEVEASPRVSERTKNKGKRRSLSDEDVEKPTQSEASFRSSQAATFDTLRERLTNSHTQIKDQQTVPDYFSHDTTTILRNIHTSHSPPAATSAPQESLRMSANSQFQFESNLLEQDSEMQRVIEGFDSYEDSGPGQRLGRNLTYPFLTATQLCNNQRHFPPRGLQPSNHSPKNIYRHLLKLHRDFKPHFSTQKVTH